jgi:hypothetical protein
MKRLSLILSAAALAAPLVACEEPIACDEYAASSVTVNVEDSLGPVEGLLVEYSAGDAFVACDDFGDGSYACGWEQAGLIEIRIDDPAYELFEAEVEVEEDPCHVITEILDVVLVEIEEEA